MLPTTRLWIALKRRCGKSVHHSGPPALGGRQQWERSVALALSAVAGLCVLGLWRTWPLWHATEGEGGPLARHWRALGDRDASGWHGVAAAACVAAILACIVLLAWPQWLLPQARWALAGACAMAFAAPAHADTLKEARIASGNSFDTVSPRSSRRKLKTRSFG